MTLQGLGRGFHPGARPEFSQSERGDVLSRWEWTKNVVVDSATCTFDLVTFLFFRILAVFRPSMAPQIENAWNRLQIVWLRIKHRFDVDRHEKESGDLRRKNRELALKVEHLTKQNQVLRARHRDLSENLSQYDVKIKRIKEELLSVRKDLKDVQNLYSFTEGEKRRLVREKALLDEQLQAVQMELAICKKREAKVECDDPLPEMIAQRAPTADEWIEIVASLTPLLKKVVSLAKTYGNQSQLDRKIREVIAPLQTLKKTTLKAIEACRQAPQSLQTHLETLKMITNRELEFLDGAFLVLTLHGDMSQLVASFTQAPQSNVYKSMYA